MYNLLMQHPGWCTLWFVIALFFISGAWGEWCNRNKKVCKLCAEDLEEVDRDTKDD